MAQKQSALVGRELSDLVFFPTSSVEIASQAKGFLFLETSVKAQPLNFSMILFKKQKNSSTYCIFFLFLFKIKTNQKIKILRFWAQTRLKSGGCIGYHRSFYAWKPFSSTQSLVGKVVKILLLCALCFSAAAASSNTGTFDQNSIHSIIHPTQRCQIKTLYFFAEINCILTMFIYGQTSSDSNYRAILFV